MIEVTERRIYGCIPKYKRRLGVRVKRKIFALFIAGIMFCGYLYARSAVFELIAEVCYDSLYATTVSAVNTAVIDSVDDSELFKKLVLVEKNTAGEVVMISYDSVKVNELSRKVAEKTERILENKTKNGTPVPFFAFTGIRLLSGYGFPVYYKSIKISSVDCGFNGGFKGAGINQTLHSLYLEIICRFSVEFLSEVKKAEIYSTVLIGETVIVGKIPEIYLNGKNIV